MGGLSADAVECDVVLVDVYRRYDEGPAEATPAATAGHASVATALVELALERFRIGVTPSEDPFAVPMEGPSVARLFRGTAGLRTEPAALHYEVTGRGTPQGALTDALLTLEGLARREEPEELHLRVAELNGNRYLDLGDPTGRVVWIKERLTPRSTTRSTVVTLSLAMVDVGP